MAKRIFRFNAAGEFVEVGEKPPSFETMFLIPPELMESLPWKKTQREVYELWGIKG